MPTPNEKKALVFLAGVVLLGGTVRVWRAWAAPVPATPASRAVLDAQLQAVDSTRKAQPKRPAKRRSRRAPAVDAGGTLPGIASPRQFSLPGIEAPMPASRAPRPASRIDVDVADSAALDALPGVGPTLAARIVADRAANGSFGGMEALRTVAGVSARLSARLDTLVTFSGPQRPLNAVLPGGSTPGGKSVRRGRRRTP